MACCGRGHEIRGPQDRLSDGYTCRYCHRENQTRYNHRRKAAVELLHAAEGRGMTVADALALIRHAPVRTIQDCAVHPRLADA
ncbi:hypothetical protein EAH80_22790 [Mycobacterium hodleri]|uniref:Uncharacterized protein n=1 Tax=Mycolicibacterium hodleri TaxID=49897 RepID=A0A502E5P2_9MYCO|nr:hypothetical protein EAH80_22790 [Mycolicibacterium hodleri]